MFVGQDLGGIFHFEANPNSSIGFGELETFNDVALYPNPSSSSITISSNESNLQRVVILDLNGGIVLEQSEQSSATMIDIVNFAKGIYVVKIELESGQFITKKLVKQ